MTQTRCPHCQSVFKIRAEDIQARNGMVRCGACLQVFRAETSMMGSTSDLDNDVRTPAYQQVVDESWAEELLAEAEKQPTKINKQKPEVTQAIPLPTLPDDHLHHGTVNNIKISLGHNELSDFMLNPLQEAMSEKRSTNLNLEPSLVRSDLVNPDEAWAQEVLHELEQDPPVHSGNSDRLDSLFGATSPPLASATAELQDSSFSFGDEQALDFLNDNDLQIRTRTSTHQPVITYTEEELTDPLLIASGKSSIKWGQLLLWGTLDLLGMLVLMLQFIYFNSGYFQENAHLFPWIQRICQPLHCRESANDTDFVRVDMLIVRPDTESGRILIDTLIHNISNIDHPFPTLRLSMQDINGNVIGSSLIAPQTYLGSAFNQLSTFAPDTPVHVSLMVVDPKVPVATTSLVLAN